MRVYQYYLPIYFWMRQQLSQHKERLQGKEQPLTIGMQAPQARHSLCRPTAPAALWTRCFYMIPDGHRRVVGRGLRQGAAEAAQ